ncbi:MAG: TetR family transcriptional regulator [Micromonosporaceae bacterium]|nr:TetR family transcriptional regulator [Micromonosporaceae bacterium]
MSTATEPRWRRLEPDQRRSQILACARRLFGARPYSEVSATEIARQAGVARGLINHYFGSKRDLYIEVMREALTIPASAVEKLPRGSVEERVDAAVDWLLDMLTRHGDTWLAATGAQGLGPDPELERILAEADDESAARVLDALGFGDDAEHREELLAMVRSYSAMAKAAGREWLVRESLNRAQVHSLLTRTLLAVVRDAFPAVRGERA